MAVIIPTPITTSPEILQGAMETLGYMQDKDGLFHETGLHYGMEGEWFPVDEETVSAVLQTYGELISMEIKREGNDFAGSEGVYKAVDALAIILAEIKALAKAPSPKIAA